MKKNKWITKIAACLAVAVVLAGCASAPKSEGKADNTNAATFTRDYGNAWCRFYSVNDYLEGIYRSNFKNIPQSETLESVEGYDYSVGTFVLDGTKLYLGWGRATYSYKTKDGETVSGEYNYLKLSDDNGVIFDNSKNKNEVSYFRFEGNTGSGVVTQVSIKGKDYVVALAGRNTDSDGFKMWVEDSVATDKADTATDQYGYKNYDWDDFFEGVYKPGYKRLWGENAPEYADWYDYKNCSTYKYNYNGVDFVVGFDKDCNNTVRTLDNKKMEPASKTYFKIMSGNKGKRDMTLGYCFEGQIDIGGKKVTMAVACCNGDIRVFIKE